MPSFPNSMMVPVPQEQSDNAINRAVVFMLVTMLSRNK